MKSVILGMCNYFQLIVKPTDFIPSYKNNNNTTFTDVTKNTYIYIYRVTTFQTDYSRSQNGREDPPRKIQVLKIQSLNSTPKQ